MCVIAQTGNTFVRPIKSTGFRAKQSTPEIIQTSRKHSASFAYLQRANGHKCVAVRQISPVRCRFKFIARYDYGAGKNTLVERFVRSVRLFARSPRSSVNT